MSYPDPLYHGDSGLLNAAFRPHDHPPELTYPTGGTVHYLSTGDSTGGKFGLYRWEMAAGPSGPDGEAQRAHTAVHARCVARIIKLAPRHAALLNACRRPARAAQHRDLRGSPDIVMLGDSLTEWGNWHELVPEYSILNRGISGDTSSGVLDRLQEVIERRPKVVFVMIGTNDIGLQSAPYARSSAAPTESP